MLEDDGLWQLLFDRDCPTVPIKPSMTRLAHYIHEYMIHQNWLRGKFLLTELDAPFRYSPSLCMNNEWICGMFGDKEEVWAWRRSDNKKIVFTDVSKGCDYEYPTIKGDIVSCYVTMGMGGQAEILHLKDQKKLGKYNTGWKSLLTSTSFITKDPMSKKNFSTNSFTKDCADYDFLNSADITSQLYKWENTLIAATSHAVCFWNLENGSLEKEFSKPNVKNLQVKNDCMAILQDNHLTAYSIADQALLCQFVNIKGFHLDEHGLILINLQDEVSAFHYKLSPDLTNFKLDITYEYYKLFSNRHIFIIQQKKSLKIFDRFKGDLIKEDKNFEGNNILLDEANLVYSENGQIKIFNYG
ncbi:MAG: hypothetical protein LW832_03525 [Parachlamydia sp.]|nr:hypothetical protein [Parachlamydia sp.]